MKNPVLKKCRVFLLLEILFTYFRFSSSQREALVISLEGIVYKHVKSLKQS
jgi:hypothetical protein